MYAKLPRRKSTSCTPGVSLGNQGAGRSRRHLRGIGATGRSPPEFPPPRGRARACPGRDPGQGVFGRLQPASLPPQVAVKGGLVGRPVALHRVFTPDAQVDPPAAAVRPTQRHPAVNRQQARPLVHHQPVADIELDLFRRQARRGVGLRTCVQCPTSAPPDLPLPPDRRQRQP